MIRNFNDPVTGASAALMAVLDQSQDCVTLMTRDGRMRFINANGLSALGISDFSKLVDQPWLNLWPEACQPAVQAALAAVSEGKKSRFQAHLLTAAGETRWWDVVIAPFEEADAADRFALATAHDVSIQFAENAALREARDTAEHLADQLGIVSMEMAHRLKNLLTVVGAVAMTTARHSDDVPDFMRAFLSRITAIGKAQELLTGEDKPLTLGEVIHPLIEGIGDTARLKCDPVPQASIDEQSVRTLALALNELITNAHKYGAFTQDGGTVRLGFRTEGDKAHIHWRERGIATPNGPKSNGRGAGHQLIDRMCQATGNQFTIDWIPGGLDVRFTVSLR